MVVLWEVVLARWDCIKAIPFSCTNKLGVSWLSVRAGNQLPADWNQATSKKYIYAVGQGPTRSQRHGVGTCRPPGETPTSSCIRLRLSSKQSLYFITLLLFVIPQSHVIQLMNRLGFVTIFTVCCTHNVKHSTVVISTKILSMHTKLMIYYFLHSKTVHCSLSDFIIFSQCFQQISSVRVLRYFLPFLFWYFMTCDHLISKTCYHFLYFFIFQENTEEPYSDSLYDRKLLSSQTTSTLWRKWSACWSRLRQKHLWCCCFWNMLSRSKFYTGNVVKTSLSSCSVLSWGQNAGRMCVKRELRSWKTLT